MTISNSSLRNYVSLILDDNVRIEEVTTELQARLPSFGGRKQVIDGNEVWRIPFDGAEQLGKLLGQLRDLGVLFGGSPAGWPPSEVFAYLRDRGLIAGEFQEVLWSGPGKWFVRTR